MAEDGSIIITTKLDTDGIEKGLEELKTFVKGGLKTAQQSAEDLLKSVEDAIEAAPVMQAAEKIISSLVQGLSDSKPQITAGAQSTIEAASEGISARSGSFLEAGAGLLSAVITGFYSNREQLLAAAGECAALAAEQTDKSSDFSDVGANLMAALRSGISAGASSLYAKASEIATAVVTRFKELFKIHSPSAVFRDEIGKMLMLGLEDGILENSEAVLAATEALAESMLKSEREYLEQKERIDELNDIEDENRRVKEYEKKLSMAQTWAEQEEIIEEERLRLRKRADSKYLEQLKDAAEKERDIINQLKDDITEAYNDIAQYAQSSLEPINESRESLESKLKKYAEENNSAVVTATIKGSGEFKTTYGGEEILDGDITLYSLADQQKSIDVLLRYSKALNSVKERTKELFGSDTAREFMETLADMDVEEGVIFAETLAAANDADFARYIEDWGEKNTLAKEISKQLYGEEFTEAVDDCTEYMRSELEKMGLEIPDGFFASGSLSAEEFGRGFSEGLNEVLEEARSLIESFAGYASETIGSSATSVVNNNNYYSSYSINAAKSTAAESIYAIEAASTMNKYRGLE